MNTLKKAAFIFTLLILCFSLGCEGEKGPDVGGTTGPIDTSNRDSENNDDDDEDTSNDGNDDDDGTEDDDNNESNGGDDDEDTEQSTIGTHVADKCESCVGYKGVDMLVVVDDSGSMEEEQQVLATSFFTLVNTLVNPTEDWEYGAASSIRVGIVTSDLGFQYGEDGKAATPTPSQDGCSGNGKEGAFVMNLDDFDMPDEIVVSSEKIKCDDDGNQCPEDWDCDDGYCVEPDGDDQGDVDCSSVDDDWADKNPDNDNTDIANQVACMAQVGTAGCGVEQQLSAAITGLTRDDQSDFLRSDHLLAVLVVSDEEDCSVKDKDIYDTPEWPEAETRNTFCNIPEENEENFLFDAKYFYETLVDLKGGRDSAVVFAAIVGVPIDDDNTCEGLGDTIDDCLDHKKMEYVSADFETSDGFEYTHLEPACQREEGGEVVTDARPGRRYVKVAQEFGCLGYVYSICNDDWSPAMTEIARLIAQCIIV